MAGLKQRAGACLGAQPPQFATTMSLSCKGENSINITIIISKKLICSPPSHSSLPPLSPACYVVSLFLLRHHLNLFLHIRTISMEEKMKERKGRRGNSAGARLSFSGAQRKDNEFGDAIPSLPVSRSPLHLPEEHTDGKQQGDGSRYHMVSQILPHASQLSFHHL